MEVHPVLGSKCGSRRGGEGQDQHSLCRDQASQSQTQNSSHADCGALCFRSVLLTNQRPQYYEKVRTSSARLPLKANKSRIALELPKDPLSFFTCSDWGWIFQALIILCIMMMSAVQECILQLTFFVFSFFYRVLGSFKNTNDRETVYAWFTFSHWLIYANSAANPIIYNFLSGEFLSPVLYLPGLRKFSLEK